MVLGVTDGFMGIPTINCDALRSFLGTEGLELRFRSNIGRFGTGRGAPYYYVFLVPVLKSFHPFDLGSCYHKVALWSSDVITQNRAGEGNRKLG